MPVLYTLHRLVHLSATATFSPPSHRLWQQDWPPAYAGKKMDSHAQGLNECAWKLQVSVRNLVSTQLFRSGNHVPK